ncbi:metal ABC transporter permease [Geminicoccaceae bacterium 1502E]|nr:metal ABC transporter permease [Geminicoccaceae bacterium 1502E]
MSIGHETTVWPSLDETLRVLTFQGGFNTSVVLVGVTLLGVAAGLVGTFAVLRRRALMSDTLSHATLPGITLAFIAAVMLGASGRSLPVLLAGAALSGILGVLTVQFISRHTRLPEDAAMGAVLSVFFGLGFVLLSYIQTMATGEQGGIGKFIYGQTATMGVTDATVIGIVALGTTLASLLLFKEFRLVCFDPDYATVLGWRISLIDLAMMALVVAVTVVGLRAVGLILVIALVVIPPAAARFWTERLWVMAVVAAFLGGLSGYLGAAASALFPRFPAGGIIVLVAGFFFLLSLLFAPARGVLAAGFRQLRLRRDIASQHLLRGLFEAGEAGGGEAVPAAALRSRVHGPAARLALTRLTWQGLIARRPDGLRLTPKGREEALRITRNHRLWEQFLMAYADLAPSHVDHSADLVEHVLSSDMVQELERQLRARGRLPRHAGPPPSPHPLASGA